MAEGGEAKKTTMSREEQVEVAKNLKTEGNTFFKTKNLKKAIGKYHRSLLYIKAAKQNKCSLPLTAFMSEFNDKEQTPISESLLKEANKLEVDCYNNLSACLLLVKPPNYEKILHYCDQVLETEQHNTKALYRRGVSLYHLRNFDKALESLNLAKTHGGENDTKVKQYIEMCNTELLEQDKKMKAVFKGMFTKMATTNGTGDS